MGRITAAALCAAFLLLLALRSSAQTDSLTLDQALALARERGPRILAAAARVDEARGRLTSASVLLRENPVFEGGAGQRYSDEGDTFAASAGIHQSFEVGGQRRARIAGAEAAIDRASTGRDDSMRQLLRDVGRGFYAGLHAEQMVRVAVSSEEIANEVARIADRRHRAEDVPILDVNLSRAAVARARAEREAAEAERASALGDVRVLLGMDASERLNLTGALQDRLNVDPVALLAGVDDRPDLRVLEARLAEAEAELRLARGEAWPDLGLGARYERDERDDVVLAELSFALPVFDRTQGAQAEARARANRLRSQLDSARRAAGVEVQTALEVHARRVKAADDLETLALPLLDENESLARRSYEAGEMPLAELLLVRRETLDTRREYLDRLLDAAVASLELQASAGALQ